VNDNDEGEMGDCAGDDVLIGGDMLASCAWVNDRPDCERNEDVRPTDAPGRAPKIGVAPCIGGVDRSSDVDGEEAMLIE
jgi:hypothetical protein